MPSIVRALVASFGPVSYGSVVNVIRELFWRRGPFPKELAGSRLQANQNAVAPLHRTDKNLPLRDGRRGIDSTADSHSPSNVMGCGQVDGPVGLLFPRDKRLRQALFRRNHVLRIGAAPLGPIAGGGTGDACRQQEDRKAQANRTARQG